MTKVNSDQTEDMGRMRIELIAADLQNRLNVCTDSLNDVGGRLSQLIQEGCTEKQLRDFLSEEKKKEIASTGRTCLNIFCVTMSTPTNEAYISSVYLDAFTGGMCFTVADSFDDGKFLLGMDYNMNDIQSYITKMGGEDYGEAMIVNSDGTIAGYTD